MIQAPEHLLRRCIAHSGRGAHLGMFREDLRMFRDAMRPNRRQLEVARDGLDPERHAPPG